MIQFLSYKIADLCVGIPQLVLILSDHRVCMVPVWLHHVVCVGDATKMECCIRNCMCTVIFVFM